jgi:predicted aspartyl protease
MCKILACLLLCVAPLFLNAQTLGFSITGGKSRVQIPIEVQNNLIIVPVILNGQVPLKFILDTGVRTTILTEKTYSDILRLTYARKYLIAGPGGEKIIEAYITNNVTLDLPGIHGEGHTMLVLEKDYLELRNYLGTEVHGILGYELFSRFIVQINYEKKMLILQLPEFFKAPRKFQELPMVVQDTKPYVYTEIEMTDSARLKTKLLMDTGASHGLILEPESDSIIKVPPQHINSIIGRGLGGVITGKIGRIKSLEIGKYKINSVLANFPDINSYNDTLKTSRHVFRNGAIGGEILSRFDVIFNFPADKVYFKKNAAFGKKFYFNLSGVTIKARGARLRKFEITDVRKDSSAEKADIKVGDVILFINGIAVTSLDLNQVNGYLNSKPGRRISFDMERNGERIKRVFKLENQI